MVPKFGETNEMEKTMKNKNLYNYVCEKCGSENIRRDAHCKWNAHKQQWEVANYADGKDYCLNCQKSQQIKEVIYEELEKGDGLHCELCGAKVEGIDDLNEYDDMFDNAYQCCDSCAEKLEQGIMDIVFAMRDKAFRNKNRQHK